MDPIDPYECADRTAGSAHPNDVGSGAEDILSSVGDLPRQVDIRCPGWNNPDVICHTRCFWLMAGAGLLSFAAGPACWVSIADLADRPDVTKPLAGWMMEESTGQWVADSTGNGHRLVLGTTDATEQTDPAWTTDSSRVCGSGALEFDGIDDVATAADIPAFNSITAFSLTFCLYPTGVGVDDYGRVLSREAEQFDDLYVNIRSDHLGLDLYNTDGQGFASNSVAGSLTLNTRSCWAITYDDNGPDRTPHIYKNGAEVAYSSYHEPVTGTYKTTLGVFRVGNSRKADRPFQGVIDSLRIDRGVLPLELIRARSGECGL
jgi:hypothetical protein